MNYVHISEDNLPVQIEHGVILDTNASEIAWIVYSGANSEYTIHHVILTVVSLEYGTPLHIAVKEKPKLLCSTNEIYTYILCY